jgi:hypothetical protein
MSQVTIYLEEAIERKVRRRAKAEGLSLSKWIAKTIAASERDCWPPQVLASFGTWHDVAEPGPSFGKDSPRERLD